MSARLVAARRSAIVPHGGAFAGLRVEDLAAPVIAALLADAGIGSAEVDELICAEAIGLGGNPARRIALAAGLDQRVAGLTIDRQCAGGLDAIALGAALIAAGQARVVIAGGVESHSRRPIRQMPDADRPYLQAPFTPWPGRDPDMTEAAAKLADLHGISRAAQDRWAQYSHDKALARGAWPEIVAIDGKMRDPFARPLSSRLLNRVPVLSGTVTSATTAPAADGAAFAIMVAGGTGGMELLASCTLGAAPDLPGLAPVPAARAALVRAGLGIGDLAQAEIMEAYAAQAIACVEGLELPVERVNPGGGALARGHAIGASGAVLAVRLFHDLRPGQIGLAAIAAAGGLGTAAIFRAAAD